MHILHDDHGWRLQVCQFGYAFQRVLCIGYDTHRIFHLFICFLCRQFLQIHPRQPGHKVPFHIAIRTDRRSLGLQVDGRIRHERNHGTNILNHT